MAFLWIGLGGALGSMTRLGVNLAATCSAQCLVSPRSSTGFAAALRTQLGGTVYYDVAGRPGDTVGLDAAHKQRSRHTQPLVTIE